VRRPAVTSQPPARGTSGGRFSATFWPYRPPRLGSGSRILDTERVIGQIESAPHLSVGRGRAWRSGPGRPVGSTGSCFTTAILGGKGRLSPRGDTSLLFGRARLTAFVPFVWFGPGARGDARQHVGDVRLMRTRVGGGGLRRGERRVTGSGRASDTTGPSLCLP
jgi:hypothetical protein